jgi:pimeloyl-ACP methyl ester carboxylesterase
MGDAGAPPVIRRRLVDTTLGQVHVRCKDGYGRPLVMLHMSPRSSRMFERIQCLLHRPVFAPDRLGYGLSDAPARQDMGIADYAANLLEVIDALGVGADYDLLGVHTGALEAIEAAHRAPHRVRRVAVVALPVFNAAEREAMMARFAPARVVAREDGGHLLEAWQARFQYRSPPFDLEDVQRRFVDYLLAPWPGQAYAGVFRYDAEPKVRTLQAPLTVFSPDDDIAEVTRRSRPMVPAGTQWLELPGCGVDLFTCNADQMRRLIDQCLPTE